MTRTHESAQEWWEALASHVDYGEEFDADGALLCAGGTLSHPVASWDQIETPESALSMAYRLAGGDDAPRDLVAAYECLIEYGRAAREDAIEIERLLDSAAEAHARGDRVAAVDLLRQASRCEMEYGDDPSTGMLVRSLGIGEYTDALWDDACYGCECECGAATGEQCAWVGHPSETVVVEYMPEYLRASHAAAGNSGTYPSNGALRLRVHRDCADALAEDTEES